MGQFRDWINEARNNSVPVEFRIALGQLKRMYNPGEVPSEKELEKDVEIIAKKNHLDAEKFLEFAKAQFKMNESKAKFKVGDFVWIIVKRKGRLYPKEFKISKANSNPEFYYIATIDNGYNVAILPGEFVYATEKEALKGKFFDETDINPTDKNGPYRYLYESKINESAVGTPGRTTIKDAEDHINDELVAEFKKIIKKLGGKTVAKVLLDKLGQKPEIKDEIEHIEDMIDNSNY